MSTLSHSQPSSSNSHGDELPLQEQCLRNADLLEEILDHLPSGGDREDLQAHRRSLLWIALTCKDFSPSAVKFLWRRLDNLLPLLRLLPAFAMRDGIYRLTRAMQPHQWECFDRHAALVQEIIHEDVLNTIHIDPSVYMVLIVHTSIVLPKLRGLALGPAARPSASEVLIYVQSPLQTVALNGGDLMATEMVMSSSAQSTLRRLILVAQPFTILSANAIPLEHLMSLELRDMQGIPDTKLFIQLGSLSHLRSFSADFQSFRSLTQEILPAQPADSPPSRLEQSLHGTLFPTLTRLSITGDLRLEHSALMRFIPMIGNYALQSLILRRTPMSSNLGWIQNSDAREAARKRCNIALNSIAHQQWFQNLRSLEITVTSVYNAVFKHLGRLSGLHSLTLDGVLFYPYGNVDIFTALAGLSHLEKVSFNCRFHVYRTGPRVSTQTPLNMRHIANLAQTCPTLRELHVPISGREILLLPETPPLSHKLRTLVVHSSDEPMVVSSAILLARHIDRLFPRLNSLRYEGGQRNDEAIAAAWAVIPELVFTFQDVRRTALVQTL
ncbi:hypothetical protein C8R46DRAFT_962184 [Mycena filopes]|nr:hypothetical protein C8R46DRAFT_962184 [Mycena filopes]